MQIGRKELVTNLRDIWPTEPQFSDWLATVDGLALIAEDLGVEIEDPQRETQSSDYRCDIVGHLRDEEDHIVVVENQFGKTNHDHLGKLLTYAAVHSAVTAIWIAERASDDHRKAIDWLNDNTPVNLSLYLAEIKAYRIGDSPVAPELSVICKPNIKVKTMKEASNAGASQMHEWRRTFWEEITACINTPQVRLPLPPAGTSEYTKIRFGKSDIGMYLGLIPIAKRIRCALWIGGKNKDARFDLLRSQQSSIEAEIGQSLEWMPRPNRKTAAVYLEAMIDP